MVIDILDIVIIFLIGILFYRLIRRTGALKIMSGLLVIYAVSLLTDYFGLEKTTYILKESLRIISYGLVVLFAPELRIILGKIGGLTDFSINKQMEVLTSIEETVFSLSEKKTGALIIIDDQKKLSYQAIDRIKIDAACTNELLETIFFVNTPLHDGAVIIQEDKIAFAGCKLPLSGKKRKEFGNLGTRHLAAIETAENFDVKVIVVSEETGNISIATNNGLHRIKSSAMFRSFFQEKDKKEKKLKNFLKKIKK